MTAAGAGIVTLADAAWEAADGARHAALTEALGAVELSVDAYQLARTAAVPLPADREHLLVPIDATDPLAVAGGAAVPPVGVGRVPAGASAVVRGAGADRVLVVGAPAEAESDAPATAVALDDCEYTVPTTSDVATAFLTGPLGCAGMKVNARRLEPGQAVPLHTEGAQEELFVPVRGPATMRIGPDRYETPVGTVARVAPAVPRSAVNEGDATALWVMVGAPPTGGATDWDPGAEIVE